MLSSRFGGHSGGIVEGEKRKRTSSPGQPGRFSMATKKVLACSHSRSLQLPCAVGGNQAKLDARSEFESRQRGGVKLVVQQAVS